MKYVLLLNLLFATILHGQSDYQMACNTLKTVAFDRPFHLDQIEAQLARIAKIAPTVSEDVLQRCNCADTLWTAAWYDRRRFVHTGTNAALDTTTYLRFLAGKIDSLQLNATFRQQHAANLQDSLHLVLQSIALKDAKKENPAFSTFQFYYFTGAEMAFLNANRERLRDQYFKIFDAPNTTDMLRDRILLTFFNSDASIETAILDRIVDYQKSKLFYRMLGILRTSGTNRSATFLLDMLKNTACSAQEKDSILQAIHGMKKRKQLTNKTQREFENYLADSK